MGLEASCVGLKPAREINCGGLEPSEAWSHCVGPKPVSKLFVVAGAIGDLEPFVLARGQWESTVLARREAERERRDSKGAESAGIRAYRRRYRRVRCRAVGTKQKNQKHESEKRRGA